MKWTETETMLLVTLYKDFECLWNCSSMEYRNKRLRIAAYEEIVQKMEKPNFGVKELKQKIKNLRCTYNQELAKIQKSKMSAGSYNEVYVPNIKWFSLMYSFIKNIKSCEDIEDVVGLMDMDTPPLLFKKEEKDTEERWQTDTPQSMEMKPPSPIITTSPSSPSETPTLKRKRKVPGHLAQFIHNGGKTLPLPRLSTPAAKKHFNTNSVVQQHKYSSEFNENEAFGQYVTASLNMLPPTQAIMAQADMQAVLTNYRLAMHNASSTSVQTDSDPDDLLKYVPTSPKARCQFA